MKTIWKRYGKIVVAAVFLTVAGLYYGFVVRREELIRLGREESRIQNVLEKPGISLAEPEPLSIETQADPPMIYVHICGEVNKPGVYELPEGSRIFEAVEAAGGFTEEAAEASLNLAQVISDEAQIVILTMEEAEEKARMEREQAAGIVNINTASKEQLMTLTGIGESRAEDIIRYRSESGGFQSIEEIMNVPGIKESAYLKIKDSITV
ncbi:MAG: hypothetical protein E7246_01865 [Lachnoclostridium sp.]|nr:hypothetical protein [Lachnoclostridium sp.]